MTHGPPHGILDEVNGYKAGSVGCEHLRRAVERARPRMHVFGHIHEGWGAERVDWTKGTAEWVAQEFEGHRSNSEGTKNVVERGWIGFDGSGEEGERKVDHSARADAKSGEGSLRWGEETLFVNAAIMTVHYRPMNPPWIVDLNLPAKDVDSDVDAGLLNVA